VKGVGYTELTGYSGALQMDFKEMTAKLRCSGSRDLRARAHSAFATATPVRLRESADPVQEVTGYRSNPNAHGSLWPLVPFSKSATSASSARP